MGQVSSAVCAAAIIDTTKLQHASSFVTHGDFYVFDSALYMVLQADEFCNLLLLKPCTVTSESEVNKQNTR